MINIFGYQLASQLARNWGAVVLRGVAAIIFGILAFIWPGITLLALTFLFGAYAFVDGTFALYSALFKRIEPQRGWIVLEGLIGVIVGVLTLLVPGLTAFTLVLVIGFWAIATGIFEIMAAMELQRQIRNEWLLIISGVLSVIFGVLVLSSPGAGALGIIWIIATYALIFGILLVGLGLRLRDWAASSPGQTPLREGPKPVRRKPSQPVH